MKQLCQIYQLSESNDAKVLKPFFGVNWKKARIYNVAQTFNTFYTAHSVLKAESEEKKQLRLQLCQLTANVIKHAMGLLGIKVPERM